MFSFISKNKLFSKHKAKAKPGYTRYINLIGSDAFADWVIILSISCVIALFLIGVGSYVYVDTEAQLSAQANISVTSSKASHFDVKKLTSVITTFDARANERVLLSKGYVGPKDPSLP